MLVRTMSVSSHFNSGHNEIQNPTLSTEIRFKQNGLKGIEVVDNGCGIAEQDHDSIGMHSS